MITTVLNPHVWVLIYAQSQGVKIPHQFWCDQAMKSYFESTHTNFWVCKLIWRHLHWCGKEETSNRDLFGHWSAGTVTLLVIRILFQPTRQRWVGVSSSCSMLGWHWHTGCGVSFWCSGKSVRVSRGLGAGPVNSVSSVGYKDRGGGYGYTCLWPFCFYLWWF